jgi:hypothetical protein
VCGGLLDLHAGNLAYRGSLVKSLSPRGCPPERTAA